MKKNHFTPDFFHARAVGGQKGFTLIEAIIVIVLTAAISAAVAVFIRVPVQEYTDSVARADLTDVADTALRRMARDLRMALPNSLRSNGAYLELLLTKTGGRYLAEEDGVAGNSLVFDTGSCPAACVFDVIGTMPTSEQAIVSGDYIVVYNLGPGLSPADAYDCTGSCNRATVQGNPAGNTITLASNPFLGQPAGQKMKSPTKRFQVVSGPVTYFCDTAAGQLKRYWGYAIQQGQPVNSAAAPLSGANTAILASGVQSCTFSYQNVANTHSGLITLSITLTSNGETVTLMHQVHVDNTP